MPLPSAFETLKHQQASWTGQAKRMPLVFAGFPNSKLLGALPLSEGSADYMRLLDGHTGGLFFLLNAERALCFWEGDVTRERPWYLPWAEIRYGRIFLQCCWEYHRSELICESDADTHTHTHTRTCTHTQVELQISKQITNALWIVNLLCPCSTTLHNEQGVFQCQYSVLQFFEIRAQQQQIDQNKHASKPFAFNSFKTFWWFCKKSQQLGNYL